MHPFAMFVYSQYVGAIWVEHCVGVSVHRKSFHRRDNKVDKDIRDNFGRTPLHEAAFRGHLKILRILIKHHVDKNLRDKNDNTALHLAASEGHFEACRILLKNKVLKNSRDMNGLTALHLAARNGHLDACKFLIEGGVEKVQETMEKLHLIWQLKIII